MRVALNTITDTLLTNDKTDGPARRAGPVTLPVPPYASHPIVGDRSSPLRGSLQTGGLGHPASKDAQRLSRQDAPNRQFEDLL
jgi:hypothetical protein